MFNLGFIANHQLPKTYACSQQSASLIPNLPVSSEVTSNQSLPNAVFPPVQPLNQHYISTFSKDIFNDGVGTKKQMFNAPVISSVVPNAASDGSLTSTSVGSYQQMANSSHPTNQRALNLPSNQWMLNAATAHSLSAPTPCIELVRSQPNLYYQRSASNSGRSIQVG